MVNTLPSQSPWQSYSTKAKRGLLAVPGHGLAVAPSTLVSCIFREGSSRMSCLVLVPLAPLSSPPISSHRSPRHNLLHCFCSSHFQSRLSPITPFGTVSFPTCGTIGMQDLSNMGFRTNANIVPADQVSSVLLCDCKGPRLRFHSSGAEYDIATRVHLSWLQDGTSLPSGRVVESSRKCQGLHRCHS